MIMTVYRATCLTNLHMGSGDVNYNIIDLEVERDPVLGEPTMNASGVKGALRDACEKTAGADSPEITYIFGGGKDHTQGAYKFFSGDLMARPVRVSSGSNAYVLATSPSLIGHIRRNFAAFGIPAAAGEPPILQDGIVICGIDGVSSVEGIKANKKESPLLDALLGTNNWAYMTDEQLNKIDLPVTAHNVLEDGQSRNLWYEQSVPHESIFCLMVGRPEECADDNPFERLLGFTKDKPYAIVQFGAGATTGNGFVRLEKAWEA